MQKNPPHKKIYIQKQLTEGVLKNFAKPTGKCMWRSPSFKKVTGYRILASNFVKEEISAQVISCVPCEIV